MCPCSQDHVHQFTSNLQRFCSTVDSGGLHRYKWLNHSVQYMMVVPSPTRWEHIHGKFKLHRVNYNDYWYRSRGWATFSKWDGLTCTWTCFSRRIQIQKGKFEIPTRSPCMVVSMGVAEIDNMWSTAMGNVQLGPGPVFWGESRSEKGNMKFPPDHTVWLF